MSIAGTKRSRPRVLIADDDPSIRIVMREVLEQAGFDILEAADGREALSCYERFAPDAILLDVEMPHADGFAVCEKIRGQEIGRKTPICIVTGLDDSDSVDRAFHVGATDFIGKPIAWPVLGHRVRYILRANEALNGLQGLVQALPDVVFILDEQGTTRERVTYIDTRVSADVETTNRVSFEDLFPEEDIETIRQRVKSALRTGEPQIHEHYYERGDTYFETRLVARDRHSVLAIVRDMTERKKADLQIHDLAFYDQLTGLPNRQLFSREVDAIIESTRTRREDLAVLFVDLDRFKRINDTLGHSIGDELLKAVASRLNDCLRSADQIVRTNSGLFDDVRLARLGGDEFVIFLRDVASHEAAASVASRILRSLARPFNCEGHQCVVTPSIGIAIYPQDGKSNDELLMNADSAMYKAKAAGRNNFKFYSETMKVRSLHRLQLENDLRWAIENEKLEIYYQPKVDVASWTIAGAEALLRWKHPDRGRISPADFIPIAEETGLILPLGEWVLRSACRQLAKWQASDLSRLSVSVNISGQQLYSDDIVGIVRNAVAGAGIRPQLLDLEITESLMLREIDASIELLNQLRELGVSLSIDDFGTGYSSLSYLKRLPINVLKIDRSFVRDLHRDPDDAAICAAILAMAHNLDLEVVAEGVELEDQLEFLRRRNCEQIQGFYFSEPLPVRAFEALCRTHAANSANLVAAM